MNYQDPTNQTFFTWQIWSGCWSLGLLTRKWCCTLVQTPLSQCATENLVTGSWIRTICWAFPAIWHDVMRRYIFFRVCWSDLRFGFLRLWEINWPINSIHHSVVCSFKIFFLLLFFEKTLWLCVNVLFKSEYNTHFKFQSKQVETSNGGLCFAKRVGSKWWPSSNGDQTCFPPVHGHISALLLLSHVLLQMSRSETVKNNQHQPTMLECLSTNKICLNGKGVHHFYSELMGL